ncbi:MAG: hydroxymethylbilane synthase [Elusimicrobia bacterium RIFCSPLOWO2_02_FULL_39_32]|nr:MAG: hydroxymethylbilane synthase [Elusimicrobia bacterium RIFCSPHIGHO2_02_FULL_39_36]OGR91509.1 MAG: hydroxymethylbilane synthase [Elusimicrobia bacterium RIFCSPLOWO2_02_FULL_39_32]OGS00764.1 MAG: hydroxymethylbilane synthase [Elusimicrobia bacterium RIFCSPLOWO2_12_FULL_39_28]
MQPGAQLKVGTRGSKLALTQTGLVVKALEKKFPKFIFKVEVIKTLGDKIQESALSQIGAKGLFIKELEEALVQGKIDCAVHSLKDLTTDLPQNLSLGAVLKRESAEDCLITLQKTTLDSLPKAAKLGTSSLRRKSQLLHLRPDFKVENLRGNLDTRIHKLKTLDFDGIVVAKAGVKRLMGDQMDSEIHLFDIPFTQLLPAAGQGALAIEIREDDLNAKEVVGFLNDVETRIAVLCERSFLRTLEGGCQVPIGAIARVEGESLSLEGMIASLDGTVLFKDRIEGSVSLAENLGKKLAEKLLHAGGEKILEELRSQR